MNFEGIILPIAYISAAAFICEAVCSVSKRESGLKRALAIISSLCVFLVAISPIISLISSLFSFNTPTLPKDGKDEADYEEIFTELIITQAENDISQNIISKFGIQPKRVSIDLNDRDGIWHVKAVIEKKDAQMLEDVEKHLIEMLENATITVETDNE